MNGKMKTENSYKMKCHGKGSQKIKIKNIY